MAILAGIAMGLDGGLSAAWPASKLPFEIVTDLALPGGATRMDYIAVDSTSHRVYLAHMGDGTVDAVSTLPPEVIGVVEGTPRVRGVLAVPELGRVYAAAAGSSEVVVIDAASLKVLGRIPAGNVDGLDYAPAVKRVFVSDQHGGNCVVIDAETDKVIKKIPVGDDVGNTRFDPATARVLVAVGSTNELVIIDPASLAAVGRYALRGVRGAHGIAVDPSTKMAYVAGEENATVCAFSLADHQVKAVATVGEGVDVLDVDPSTHRLFVASESGVVSVFDVTGGGLKKLEEGFFAPAAHVVGVDRVTHLLYFPLKDVGGHPVLRIARYTGR
ncbi:MAG TPA: YncE family protein [Thermoanaerobaculaceae bacterium]|nr:YncE family protein [Thermoanaerobaculaceae bacterium]